MPGNESEVTFAEIGGLTEVAFNFRGFEIKTLVLTL